MFVKEVHSGNIMFMASDDILVVVFHFLAVILQL